MDNNELHAKLEELNIEPDKIDEFLEYFRNANVTKGMSADNADLLKVLERRSVEKKMLAETDWKKKAALASKLMGLNME